MRSLHGYPQKQKLGWYDTRHHLEKLIKESVSREHMAKL